MTDHPVPTSPHCPDCLAVLDGALGVFHDEAPAPGAATVCAYCAAALIFTAELGLRHATGDELVALEAAPAWRVARHAAHAVIARRARR